MTYVRKMILCGVLCSFTSLPALSSNSNTDAMVSNTATINAPVKAVWEAMRTLRKNDPAHRKILSSGGGDYVVEEKFENIPVIGDAICTYREHEVPMQKLEYSMIKSDKLKAFEGEWDLTPSADGKQTSVRLSSRTDAGVRCLFADKITRSRTSKSIAERLDEIREISLRPQVASR
jgi:hypothetical protein